MVHIANALLLFAFLLLSCTSASFTIKSTDYKPIDMLANVYAGSTSVFNKTTDGLKLIGSGVIVRCEKGKTRLVLTAWHVAKTINNEQGIATVGLRAENFQTSMKVRKFDDHIDLALLEGTTKEKSSCPAVSLASQIPQLGSFVWIIGSPGGRERNISHGVLGRIHVEDDIMYYTTDSAIWFGNSGGGMYNEKGELVGIVVKMMATITPFPHLIPTTGTAVSLPHLWNFTNKELDK